MDFPFNTADLAAALHEILAVPSVLPTSSINDPLAPPDLYFLFGLMRERDCSAIFYDVFCPISSLCLDLGCYFGWIDYFWTLFL